MILFVTSFGATVNYKDPNMMRKTLDAYLTTLSRQTDQDLRLFISYHDMPTGLKTDYPFIQWCCVAQDPEHPDFHKTVVPLLPPDRKSPKFFCDFKVMSWEGIGDDMSRKIRNSMVSAINWARANNKKKFWMVSVDSDDLVAIDTVSRIHEQEKKGARAVFSRIAHMFDPRLKEMAIRKYPDPVKCSAILLEVDGDSIPHWQFLNNDHTLFLNELKTDRIPYAEIALTFCILTNTGNNISNRPEIAKEHAIQRVALTEELIARYSLDRLIV